MPNPPSLSPEARAAALEKAAMARRVRAEAKEKLKIGSLTLRELFEQCETPSDEARVLANTRVVSVLESMPGLGKVRARRVMDDFRISPDRKIQGLGRNQRDALLKHFEQG